MSILRDQPYLNNNFTVQIGGIEIAHGFQEAVLPTMQIDVVEYRSGSDRVSQSRKLPGRLSYDNLILRRGVTGSLELYEWIRQIANGDIANGLRDVIIHLFSEDRSQPVLTWRFVRAWPAGYTIAPLHAEEGETLLEELEIAFDEMRIE